MHRSLNKKIILDGDKHNKLNKTGQHDRVTGLRATSLGGWRKLCREEIPGMTTER